MKAYYFCNGLRAFNFFLIFCIPSIYLSHIHYATSELVFRCRRDKAGTGICLCQARSSTVPELQAKLHELGWQVGARILDLGKPLHNNNNMMIYFVSCTVQLFFLHIPCNLF